jgi:ribonuclease P protein component
VLRGDPASPPAVAYAIGRHVGNAVVRNRLRRRLREDIRAHSDLLETGCAYLIGAEVGAVALNATELDGLVVDVLRRAGSVS